jgi:hypothetical protein
MSDWNRCGCGQLDDDETCPRFDGTLLCEDPDPHPSLPELRRELAFWQRAVDEPTSTLTYFWRACGCRDRARAALEDALWHQGIESVRWTRTKDEDLSRLGEEGWWWVWRGVLRLRWMHNQRRGPLPGFLPTKELALR